MPSFRITHHLPLDEHHQPLLQILTHTLLQHRTGIPNYNRVHLLLSLMDLRIKMDYPRTTLNIELHTNWAIIVDEYLNTEWEELNGGEVDEDFIFAENRFFALSKLLVDGEWLPGFGKIAQTISDMVQEAVRTDIRRRREEENVQAPASDSSRMEP